MRKIYLLAVLAVMIMVSCQKEAAQVAKNPATSVGAFSAGNSTDGIGWSIPSDFVSPSTKAGKASNLSSAISYCGGITSVILYAGQNIPMGTLEYANDANNLYISYTANPDWYFTEVHLYVGDLSLTPKSGGGTPAPGKFPMKRSFSNSTLSQYEEFVIPVSQVSSTSIIAAHAATIRVEAGDVVAKETSWAAGTRFTSNKNWATYANLTINVCDGGGDYWGE